MRKIHLLQILPLAACFVLQACASTPKPAVQTPVAQPQAQVPEQPVNVQETHIAPTEPEKQVAPEIASLRQSVQKGQNDDIDKNAHAVIDRNPETPEAAEALRALANLDLQNKKFDTAQLYAETAHTFDPGNPENGLVLARCLHALNRDDDAVKLLDETIAKSPDNPGLYALKTAILLEYLDVERALQAARKAHELLPNDCGTTMIYADALYASKSFPDAVTAYESARTQCKLPETALQNLAKLYEVHTQNPQKACELYKQLADLDPNNAYYKASRDYQCSL